jgi:hypothetical protein
MRSSGGSGGADGAAAAGPLSRSPQAIHFACHLLASAAERLGPELVALYGGQTLFDARDGLPTHLDDRAVSPLLTPERPVTVALIRNYYG